MIRLISAAILFAHFTSLADAQEFSFNSQLTDEFAPVIRDIYGPQGSIRELDKDPGAYGLLGYEDVLNSNRTLDNLRAFTRNDNSTIEWRADGKAIKVPTDLGNPELLRSMLEIDADLRNRTNWNGIGTTLVGEALVFDQSDYPPNLLWREMKLNERLADEKRFAAAQAIWSRYGYSGQLHNSHRSVIINGTEYPVFWSDDTNMLSRPVAFPDNIEEYIRPEVTVSDGRQEYVERVVMNFPDQNCIGQEADDDCRWLLPLQSSNADRDRAKCHPGHRSPELNCYFSVLPLRLNNGGAAGDIVGTAFLIDTEGDYLLTAEHVCEFVDCFTFGPWSGAINDDASLNETSHYNFEPTALTLVATIPVEATIEGQDTDAVRVLYLEDGKLKDWIKKFATQMFTADPLANPTAILADHRLYTAGYGNPRVGTFPEGSDPHIKRAGVGRADRRFFVDCMNNPLCPPRTFEINLSESQLVWLRDGSGAEALAMYRVCVGDSGSPFFLALDRGKTSEVIEKHTYRMAVAALHFAGSEGTCSFESKVINLTHPGTQQAIVKAISTHADISDEDARKRVVTNEKVEEFTKEENNGAYLSLALGEPS